MADSRPHAVSERFDALDTLRCLAVLVMVQGHSFYVTLTEAERARPWHTWHDYIHGYTAPGFLFGAGLAFGFTSLSHKIDSHAHWGPVLRRRLYRYLSLFAIGYAIQLPPLGQDVAAWTTSSIRVFLRVEALQHIGAALLFCQLLVVLLRRAGAVAATTAILGMVVVLLGPAVSRMSLESLGPRALSAYWTSELGSTFPLIPWSGFVFCGVTAGAVLQRARRRVAPEWIAATFVVVGAGLALLSLGFDAWWPSIFGPHAYWKVNPYFFMRRLGWVICVLGLFAAVDCGLSRLRSHATGDGVASGSRRAAGPVRGWIRRISQQSLVVYVAHLVLLYGSPLNPGIRSLVWHRLDWFQSTLVVLGLFLALGLLLWAWEGAQQHFEPTFLWVRRAGVATMAAATLMVGVQAGSIIFDHGGFQVAEQAGQAGAKVGPNAASVGTGAADAQGEAAAALTESPVEMVLEPVVVQPSGAPRDGLQAHSPAASLPAGGPTVTPADLDLGALEP